MAAEHAPIEAPRWTVPATALALAALVFAAYGGALGNGWIQFDDPVYVLKNPHVTPGLTWDGLAYFLTGIHGGNWHPLTSLSHVLDVELFGLDPAGPHAVNVALHAAGAVLVFLALRRLTGATGASFAAALLFAVHPLRVESVAWISERKDVLSGVLLGATLLAWARWVERPAPARYALALACFALGLMAKPTLVTLPCALLLLDVWPLRRLGPGTPAGWRAGALLREKLPFFALAAASCLVTLLVQRAAGAMQTAEAIPLAQRLLNAPVAILAYVGKTAWPADLAPYYPFELRDSALVPLVCAAALAGATVLALLGARRRPWIAVGWLWFLGLLVPVLGLVQVGGQALADRYTYLPSIGLALTVTFSASAAIDARPRLRAPFLGALAAAAAALILASRAQTAHWRTSRTLAEHALEATGGRNALAHQMLANALLSEGDGAGAREHLQAALALVPNLPEAHNLLGSLLAREGRRDEAIAAFRAELAVRPSVTAWHNLGVVLSQQGRFDEAAAALQHALELDPAHRPSLVRLGIAWMLAGRPADAAARFEAALRLDARDADALRGLGAARALLGDGSAAVSAYERLLEVAPDDAVALREVARVRATSADPRLRDGAEAVRRAERARALAQGEDSGLLATLAAAYAEAGRYPEAVAAAERAVQAARVRGHAVEVERCGRQLELHRAGRPWRE